MDKLVEREAGARKPLSTAPAIAVQFFLIPLLVVGATVLVYIGFRSLLSEDRSAEEYLTDIRSGGSNRRWPAAYELSRLMADPEFVKREEAILAPELTKAFAESKNDDPRVRQYLALTLGRLTPPLPAETRQLLVDALNDKDSQTRISAIWALGSTGEASVAADIERQYQSDDAGRAQDGGVRAGVDAGRCGQRDAREGARGCRARRAVECGDRARAPRPSRRGARAAPHARPRVRRAQRDAAAAGARRSRSGRRSDDQRPARDCGAEGRRRCRSR